MNQWLWFIIASHIPIICVKSISCYWLFICSEIYFSCFHPCHLSAFRHKHFEPTNLENSAFISAFLIQIYVFRFVGPCLSKFLFAPLVSICFEGIFISPVQMFVQILDNAENQSVRPILYNKWRNTLMCTWRSINTNMTWFILVSHRWKASTSFVLTYKKHTASYQVRPCPTETLTTLLNGRSSSFW